MSLSVADAYKFFHQTTKTFSRVESNGVKIDLAYLDRAIKETEAGIKAGEAKIKAEPEWEVWRRRFKDANLQSTEQLAAVVYGELGYKAPGFTATGRFKADEAALEKIPRPFIKEYFRVKKLRKALGTYLKGIQREVTEKGLLHTSLNLAGGMSDDQKGGASSYRSSSSNPNLHNVPIRNPVMNKLIRQAFISRFRGGLLGELDFGQVEVRIAGVVTKDPKLRAYLNGQGDMHFDTATEIFLIDPDQVVKKGTRDVSKNMMVFPMFYGSVYFQCAPAIWDAMDRRDLRVGVNGVPGPVTIKEHLAKKGITELGNCSPEYIKQHGTQPGTFVHHLKQVENIMWHKRFTGYTAWKKKVYQQYLETGEVHLPTGFVCRGVYRRNQVLNLPIQGPAFHLLALAMNLLQSEIDRLKLKSVLALQIHDCMLPDMIPDEVQQILDLAHEIMTVRTRQVWDWIDVPLEAEFDLVPPGRSWYDKKLWVNRDGVWGPADAKGWKEMAV